MTVYVMRYCPSFNQTIRSILILSFVLFSVLICSCQKEEFEVPLRAYLEIKAKVEQASRENLTVDGLDYGKKVCTVLFSNGDNGFSTSTSVSK